MIRQQISHSILRLTVNDHKIKKFENLWELDQGISYNCYLLKGEKNVLIDTVEKSFANELLKILQAELKDQPLDYLIINHMEPDHSGTILALLEKYPKIKLVGNHKTIEFTRGFYDLDEARFIEVTNKDTLDLSDYSLEFHQTPMVHWPESMVTYEKNQQLLFSSDIFGGYKTVDNQVLADERSDLDEFVDQARAYFATVLGGYTRPALASLKKLKSLKIKCIAPAHGLVWQKNHQQIFELYERWASFLVDDDSWRGVTVVIGSMYGHTLQIGKLIKQELIKAGLQIDLLDVSQTTQTEQLNCVWKNQGLIIGSCTYANGLFPPIRSLLEALEERKLKNKFLGVFSSHSWTGGAMSYLKKFAENSKLKLIEPVFETKYKMSSESEQNAVLLAKKMGEKLSK